MHWVTQTTRGEAVFHMGWQDKAMSWALFFISMFIKWNQAQLDNYVIDMLSIHMNEEKKNKSNIPECSSYVYYNIILFCLW